jgi:hypothetical protein
MNSQEKIALVVSVMTAKLDSASKDSLKLMLARPNAVRVAKVANFSISGVKLNELFDTEELYEIVNSIYHYAEDLLSPIANGIEDANLLAQLQA